MSSPGPYEFRPAYPDEDVEIVVTLPDADPLDPATGFTLVITAYTPTGAAVDAGALGVSGTGAAEITATVDTTGFTTGRYRVIVRRTDAGARAVEVWGYLVITDPRSE